MSYDTVGDPLPLNPGFIWHDDSQRPHEIKEAVVRLLPRKERKIITLADPKDQNDLYLVKSIARLGDLTDANDIARAVEEITVVDETRLFAAIEKLEKSHEHAGKAEKPKVVRVLRPTDERSEPFALNPGIKVDGKEYKTCIVRMLRREEFKMISAEPDEQKRDDLALWLSIVQLGDLIDVKPEHVDLLTGPDEERINKESANLQASFRAEPKHQCPECQHRF